MVSETYQMVQSLKLRLIEYLNDSLKEEDGT